MPKHLSYFIRKAKETYWLLALPLLFLSLNLCAQDIVQFEKFTLQVFFENDEHKLNENHKIKIDSFITDKIIKKYEAFGFASSTGKKSHNLELSNNRANTIHQYLKELNLHGISEGLGVDTNSTFNDADQRRVDIIFLCEVQRIVGSVMLDPHKTDDLITKDSLLSILSNTDTLSLKSVQFFGGTDVFFPNESPPDDLYYLAEIMDSIPEMKIKIEGHVCCGDDMRLSERRAQAVYYFLKSQKINTKRMSVEGFSNTRLKVPDNTPANNQINRRVEIIITQK